MFNNNEATPAMASTQFNYQKNTLSYSWVVISFCALFLFYKYVLQVYPSIMTDSLMNEFHVDGAGLGNLAAYFFYAYLVTQVFVGVILDKFSTRLLASLAILISAIGALLFSLAHQLWMAELSRALMGFGAAFATVTYMKMAAVWFEPRQFAFVGGLLATAAMLGAIFGQAPLSFFVTTWGWRISLLLCAAVGVAFAILFAIFVRNAPTNETHRSEPTTAISLKDVLAIFKQKQNWWLTLYSGLAFSPLAVFGGLWGVPFLKVSYGFAETHAASLVSLIFFGLAIGGPLLGWLSDRLHKRKPIMFVGSLLSFICVTTVIYLQVPTWLLSIELFLFGLGTGAFMLGFAMGRELNPLPLAATIVALINTGDALFGAFTEPMVGKFLDMGWSGNAIDGAHHFSATDFHFAFLTLPVYLVFALVFLGFIKEEKTLNQN